MKRFAAFLGMTVAASGCAGQPPVHEPGGVTIQLADLLAAPPATGRPRVTIDGQPARVRSVVGDAVSFDGTRDRLVLQENPLAGADEFTIEVVIRPRDTYPDSREPRFLHIESASNPDRRLTMELRLTDRHEWYLDAFIKSDADKSTLIDATRLHAVGRWHHVAVTWRDGTFTSYVDGQLELQASVRYQPIPADARTSIGARLNRIHWFAGEIATVRVTHAALPPARFEGIPHH